MLSKKKIVIEDTVHKKIPFKVKYTVNSDSQEPGAHSEVLETTSLAGKITSYNYELLYHIYFSYSYFLIIQNPKYSFSPSLHFAFL
jgi:hypothetical protein